jgi:hypothetical protein
MSNNLAKDSSYAMETLRARVAELERELRKTLSDRNMMAEQLSARKKTNLSMENNHDQSMTQLPKKRHKLLLDVSSLSSIHS